jgi:hypothetical protein
VISNSNCTRLTKPKMWLCRASRGITTVKSFQEIA